MSQRTGGGSPRSPELCREAARALLTAGRPREAAQTLREGLAAHPEDPRLLADLAFCQLRMDRPREAEATAEAAIAVAPDFAEGHRMLGWARLEGKRGKRKALHAFEAAARLAPADPEVLASLALGLIEAGKRRRAAETIDRLTELAPQWERTREVRAVFAQRRGKWRDVEAETRAHLRSSSEDAGALLRLALAQEAQGQPVQAIETMHMALQAEPNDPDIRRQLKRLIETRYRSPSMLYMVFAGIFPPLALVGAIHLIWVRVSTNSMLQPHSPPVQRLVRLHLRHRDAGGCISVTLAVLVFFGFFWTLLTVFAWDDLATPAALRWLGGLYLAVAVLSLALWRIKRKRPSL